MNSFIKKTGDFFKTRGHKIFTFIVGLLFIAAVCFAVGRLAVGVYRIFVPNNIYTDPGYKNTLYGGSVYEARTDETYEEGSAEFFESYLANFIMQDMPDFEDPLDLNDQYIISFGIWQAITLNNYQGVYTYNSNGSFRIPVKDVEMYASYCLDFPRKIDHRSVDICGSFKYNILNKTYTVPAANIDSYLIPDILNVEKGENDTYIITADCYEGNLVSSEIPENDPANFRRRVVITLQDMGIQSYNAETGTPVPRYMILSSKTVDETADLDNDGVVDDSQQEHDKTELN